MLTIADNPLLDEPLLRRHFAGRPVDRLGLDTVLADLHQLGVVTLRVVAPARRGDSVTARYRCRLRLRTGDGECSAIAATSLDAALLCLLRALDELRLYGADGVDALGRHAHAESAAVGAHAAAGLKQLSSFLALRQP